MFGRRKHPDSEEPDSAERDELAGDQTERDDAGNTAGKTAGNNAGHNAPGDPSAPDSAGTTTAGPWDIADAPRDDVPRVDLGAMLIPMREGLELRVDMNDQRPIAATLVAAEGTLQLLAFAAPRSQGLWSDVRDELADTVRTGGGSASEAEGPFGTELHAKVKAEVERGKPVDQQLRFIGVDGRRWLLRATISGPAAGDEAKAAGLLELLRLVIVNRGEEAMAPRELLPLRLPADAATPEAEAAPSIDPFKRGPEITERR